METQNKVYVHRTFNCTVSELFNWIAKPALLALWFGPTNFKVGNVEIDFQIGGKLSIELIKPNNDSFLIQGEYIEINVPDTIAFTYSYIGLPSPPPDSTVHISLNSLTDQTSELRLVQQFELAPADMIKRTKAWNLMFTKLGNLL